MSNKDILLMSKEEIESTGKEIFPIVKDFLNKKVGTNLNKILLITMILESFFRSAIVLKEVQENAIEKLIQKLEEK